ncbi:BON domain-containing protein [Hydrogenophaga sp.]|uniref:BON domain-containing protein n=1 Tax=Hydrogenophaga sp. TaxID=1904254 RepID=UPI002730EFD8|nr:BON domain-containing protein [Hydrogenophaga sp.]MDP2018607.1 BON domain-containing protein [Hydrogenophaga sp.]MDP3809544.1 BON domain-containing protein [Hydrogenophaga sp.]
MKTTHRYTALFAAAAATVLIAACGEKVNDTTVGQQVDNSVTSAQSAGTELKNDAQVAANDMQAAGSQAAATVAESATDMAITAKVNAALAADDKLSALKIDVDTEAGNVALTGTAPDEAARERATTLAAAIDGVVTVKNRLTVVKIS